MSRRTIAACMAASLLYLLALAPPASAGEAAHANAARVREAFAAWREGRGSVFDLLHEQVEWTVAGTAPVSGVHRSKQAFMDEAVRPISARLSTPIVPTLRHVLAQDDAVVVLWDGVATARDGSTYRNHYAWHMVFEDGRVTRVTAFLDTWALARLMDAPR